MLISGAGITTPVEFKVVGGIEFSPQLAIEWFKLSNGNMVATDRSDKNDFVITKLKTHGKSDYINDIILALEANRKQDNEVVLTDFDSDEFIFGVNVDYTATVTAVLTDITLKKQKSLNGYELTINLMSSNISYLTGSGVLPDLTCLQIGYTGDTTWNASVSNTYRNINNNGEINVYNFTNDSGVFSGEYFFTNDEMKDLLYFQKTQRSTPFTLPYVGIDEPFGPRQTGPYTVTLTEIRRVISISPITMRCNIKFNQYISG